MARLDYEEQEKMHTLKTWWDRYGTIITIMLAVMIATVGGTKVWEYFQRQQAQQAADLYALVQQVQTTGDLMKITDAVHLLTEGYASSGYAPRAAMIVVKASVDAGDFKRAKAHLQWILDNAKEPEMIDLARLRLATILLDEKNYAAALQQLNTKHGYSFSGLYADLKGDVLLASGKTEEARMSYEAAAGALSKNNNYYNIVQMKADALSEPRTAERSFTSDADSPAHETGKADAQSDVGADEDAAESVEFTETPESGESAESAVPADDDGNDVPETLGEAAENGETNEPETGDETPLQTEEADVSTDTGESHEESTEDNDDTSDHALE
ncbi:MAG: tetratricopeptide repeat protein [Nitrosomonas sp.]|nr:tetratricopeptide repeat protein [Nitrosomonas sp.]MCW5606573.1 tetratricopeptide repeat protein [Nitrosomonas sp.]